MVIWLWVSKYTLSWFTILFYFHIFHLYSVLSWVLGVSWSISSQILAKFHLSLFAYDFHYLEFRTDIQIYVTISCSKSLGRGFLPLSSLWLATSEVFTNIEQPFLHPDLFYSCSAHSPVLWNNVLADRYQSLAAPIMLCWVYLLPSISASADTRQMLFSHNAMWNSF